MINHRLQVVLPQHLYEEVFWWSTTLGLTVEETARVLIATGCGALKGTHIVGTLPGAGNRGDVGSTDPTPFEANLKKSAGPDPASPQGEAA